LTAVGMSAQQQVESGVGGLPINLRGMGQQNSKGIGGNVGGRFFYIIDPIVVRIVDTGPLEKRSTATKRERQLTTHLTPAKFQPERLRSPQMSY